MGIKFKSPLALSAHRAIAHSDSAQTLEVTVVTKTSAHPEFGNGSINGYAIDGVEGPYLEFTPGNTYKFDQSDSSNTGHPLRFYVDAAKTTAYTTGVTTNGTPGSAGAYTQIVPTVSTPPILYYQCTVHSLMGSYTKFGTGSQGDTYTFSASQDGNNVDLLLDAGSGTDSTVQLTAGTNITLTRNSASEVTIDAVGDGEAVKIGVKNTSGSTITKGTPVYITGTVGASFTAEVAPADASNAAKMPSTGLLETDLAHNAIGYAVTAGLLKNLVTDPIDTVTPSINQTIYVKAGGGLTTTKPTGTNLIQNVGKIGRVSTTSAGSVIVSSILRSNDIPNIPQNNIWLGNSSSVPTATAHTVENISNVTVSSKTDGQALIWDATNSYWKNGDVASGGGGTVTVEKNVYTANGSTTTFNTSTAIVNENNVQVYIDGVYQSKDNYTTSGSTVTFSTAPPNTTSVELIHMVAVDGVIARDSFTGNGSTTAYVLSMSISNENATQVYVDGVYQSKDNYTTSGSTLTFSTAPPNGAAVEVVHIKAVDASSLNQNVFTGDGSTTAFTLSQSINDENKTFVFIQGVYQEKSTYSISGTTLTFSTAPQNGYSVEVMAFDSVTIESNSVTIDNFNGDGSTTGFALSTTPLNENVIDVYINGLYQQKNTFSLSGNTLTFSTAPPNNSTIEIKGLGNVKGVADTSTSVSVISSNTTAVTGTLYVLTASLALTLPAGVVGKSIKISNRSGVTTCTVVPNGSEKIMGSAGTMTLDTAAASFELIYSGSVQGWVIIGQ